MIKKKTYHAPQLSIIKMRQPACLIETSGQSSGTINAMSADENWNE